jgi:hypothetical protein
VSHQAEEWRGVAVGSETDFTITWADTTNAKQGVWALVRGVGKEYPMRGISRRNDDDTGTTLGSGFVEVANGFSLQVVMYNGVGLDDMDPDGGLGGGYVLEELGEEVGTPDRGALLYSKSPTSNLYDTTGLSQAFTPVVSSFYVTGGVSFGPIGGDKDSAVVIETNSFARNGSDVSDIVWTFGSDLVAGDYVMVAASRMAGANIGLRSIVSTTGVVIIGPHSKPGYSANTHEIWLSSPAAGGETAITLLLEPSHTVDRLFVMAIVRGARSSAVVGETFADPTGLIKFDGSDHVASPRGLDVWSTHLSAAVPTTVQGDPDGMVTEETVNATGNSMMILSSGLGVGRAIPNIEDRTNLYTAVTIDEQGSWGWTFEP